MKSKFTNINPNDDTEELFGDFGNFNWYGLMFMGSNVSTPVELLLMSCIVPGTSLLLSMVSIVLVYFKMRGLGFAAVINFIFLMAFTVWSDHLYLILSAIGCVDFLTACFIWKSKYTSQEKNERLQPQKSKLKPYKKKKFLDIELVYEDDHIPFLADYRGHLLLATAICILAVDFEVFPSRFAKTIVFGWSIMDGGVGCFVAVHGMFSPQARKKTTSIKKILLSSMPLLLLGFARLIAVTLVDYHRSVAEYGVHWNFFFTLAITKMACSLLCKLIPFVSSGMIAIGLGICYQCLLSLYGVSEVILSEERENLFQENKEGICSLLGFMVIYLGGEEVGKIFWKHRCKIKDWIKLLCILLAIGFVGSILMMILHHRVQYISRRMANLTYCVWVIALISLQIALHLIEHLVRCVISNRLLDDMNRNSQPLIMRSCLLWKAINYNGLFYFLLANILTGLVNISTPTDEASVLKSMCILFGYVYLLSATVICMMSYSIQVKFW